MNEGLGLTDMPSEVIERIILSVEFKSIRNLHSACNINKYTASVCANGYVLRHFFVCKYVVNKRLKYGDPAINAAQTDSGYLDWLKLCQQTNRPFPALMAYNTLHKSRLSDSLTFRNRNDVIFMNNTIFGVAFTAYDIVPFATDHGYKWVGLYSPHLTLITQNDTPLVVLYHLLIDGYVYNKTIGIGLAVSKPSDSAHVLLGHFEL